jgi:signal transduction histidine kinase
LNVLKIEAGAMDVDLESVSIERCKESCLRMMQERAHAWDISLKTTISPLLPDAHADEVRVKQVLLNLISNAVKFTNLVGSIDISAGDLGDGFIEVVLCDTGTGIPNELMDYTFKPFVQATNAHQFAHEGTGLGFALVKSFTEMMVGQVGIESTFGEGTAVRISLFVFRPSRPCQAIVYS